MAPNQLKMVKLLETLISDKEELSKAINILENAFGEAYWVGYNDGDVAARNCE